MSGSETPMTLKGAARKLGVHEQTLRSWERRGLIRMIRLPGSHYRRVPVDEVERLLQEMAIQPAKTAPLMEMPDQSAEALELAHQLFAEVRAELASLGRESTLDEYMARRRGRQWLP
ncbi:MAG: helix-turn-helix domain-containing protein [Anaerolineales bacterium]|nr:helix-turn-helix domain-containing protein [Anaerolineales bacterium]